MTAIARTCAIAAISDQGCRTAAITAKSTDTLYEDTMALEAVGFYLSIVEGFGQTTIAATLTVTAA
ncbi:MAG: hypothetical protein ABJS32_11575, partial [Anderseniella sp.]